MATINELMQIFDADFAKNHQGREYGLEEAKQKFKKYIDSNKPYYVSHNIIVIWRDQGQKIVEFHTINGGDSQDLIMGLTDFLNVMSKKFNHAITYYDNPAINELAKHSPYPTHVKKVDRGVDRTYAMVFDLGAK